MFAYDDRYSFLREINPVIKLAIIALITVIVSLSLNPLFPALTAVLVVLTLVVLGNFALPEVVFKAKFLLGMSIGFMLFMLLAKGLGNSGPYGFGIFQWQQEDLTSSVSLGLRILVLGLLSLLLVATTEPNRLVLSLMLQLKVSHVHGYAALAAYRFLPTFQKEVKKIVLAKQIRGVEAKKGWFGKMAFSFKLLIPLLSTAVRRGERVAMAMESRGLGFSKERTFYKTTTITKQDLWFLAGTILVFAFIGWFFVAG